MYFVCLFNHLFVFLFIYLFVYSLINSFTSYGTFVTVRITRLNVKDFGLVRKHIFTFVFIKNTYNSMFSSNRAKGLVSMMRHRVTVKFFFFVNFKFRILFYSLVLTHVPILLTVTDRFLMLLKCWCKKFNERIFMRWKASKQGFRIEYINAVTLMNVRSRPNTLILITLTVHVRKCLYNISFYRWNLKWNLGNFPSMMRCNTAPPLQKKRNFVTVSYKVT